ncbi:LuxR C-terminal-related transcriptional regulator [Desulfoluna spongiiphila]|uniref:LuxR C-terminal-related transcriptional regulator n=1 Tax=Desulfoluna spongiiphila TaxID=419481 RepID=UPI00125699AB|nr:LuxR C-terminal-related transcriptional regulator [Desulfoluna spongiiphila]VVS92626.1 transcription regulator luxr c-terminal [Desulfoluna spongiiphila]
MDENRIKGALLHTKLQRSHIAPDIVPRPRLLVRLEEGGQRPLTLITAPAGYGKSTLASRWAQLCGAACGWISLDAEDNDLHQFLNYFLAALKGVFPQLSLHTESLLETHPLPPIAILTRFLLNDLHQITEPFFFVLDDYHRITDPRVHDLISGLMVHPAKALHLILLSRKEPPLPVASMRGRGLVTELNGDELRLTPSEAATFLKQMGNLTVDDATASILGKKTEGWPAGLRLAGLYLQGHQDLRTMAEELSGSSTHIAEYLFAEVLSRQSPEMVFFLQETAILDRFCAPLCQRLHQPRTGSDPEASAEQFIRWLKENNLFVIGLDNEGYWFRYHHLFQDFLNKNRQQNSPSDQVGELHRVAGHWFAENGLFEEAIQHYLAAGATPDAVELVRENRYRLMNASHFTRLHHWLSAFPERILEQEPLLLTTKAVLGTDLGKNIDIYACTKKASRLLAGLSLNSEANRELKGEVLVLQGLLKMLMNDTAGSLACGQEALGYLREDAHMVRSLLVLVLAVGHQMSGKTPMAAKTVREAVAKPFCPANIQARMQICLGYAHYLDANSVKTLSAAEDCLRAIRDLPLSHTRAYAHFLNGSVLYMQNNLAAAESCLVNVLHNPYAANPNNLSDSGCILACIYLAQGRESMAIKVQKQLRAHFRENGHARATDLMRSFETEFALRRGDVKQALQLSQQAHFDAGPPRWFFYVPQLTLVKCMLAEGSQASLDKALARLTQLDNEMHRINRTNVRIKVLALLANVHQMRSAETEAMSYLQTALDLAEPGGWIRIFIDTGAPVKAALENVLKQQPDHRFARQVLGAFTLSSPTSDFLTHRETELLLLLAEGLSNKEIADKLCISLLTVKTHLKNIFRKLSAANRIGAVNRARELGIISH